MATAVPTSASLTTTTTRQTGQGDRPLPRLQVSFTTGISEPPVWVDITGYARSIDYQRGRQFELDQFQAGTLTAVLSTNDGLFSPENPIGQYYGKLTPMRRVRLVAEWDGTIYPRWAGFAESWEPSANASGKDLTTTLRATDAFKATRYVDVTGTYDAALSGNRINSLLSGIPGIEVILTSSGTVANQQVTLSNADPLGAAQTAAAAEQGFLYCDEDGRVRFDDRNYRLVNEITPRVVFGDVPGEAPYLDPTFTYTDEQLYTEVRVEPVDGAEQTASDATATASYGRRSLALTLPIQNSVIDPTPDTEFSASLAQYLLSKYKSPTIRLTDMLVHPDASPSLWSVLLDAPLGGRFVVRQRPAYLIASGLDSQTSPTKVTGTAVLTAPGSIIQRTVYVERIQETIRPGAGKWEFRYGFSDAESTTFWILGDTEFSVLGTSTILGL